MVIAVSTVRIYIHLVNGLGLFGHDRGVYTSRLLIKCLEQICYKLFHKINMMDGQTHFHYKLTLYVPVHVYMLVWHCMVVWMCFFEIFVCILLIYVYSKHVNRVWKLSRKIIFCMFYCLCLSVSYLLVGSSLVSPHLVV